MSSSSKWGWLWINCWTLITSSLSTTYCTMMGYYWLLTGWIQCKDGRVRTGYRYSLWHSRQCWGVVRHLSEVAWTITFTGLLPVAHWSGRATNRSHYALKIILFREIAPVITLPAVLKSTRLCTRPCCYYRLFFMAVNNVDNKEICT